MRSFSYFSRLAKFAGLCAMLVLLSGCGTTPPIPFVKPGAVLRPGMAYVGGEFSGQGHGVYAFILKNTQTGVEIRMPFSDVNVMYTDKPVHLAVIEIPPGTYRLTGWVNYQEFMGSTDDVVRKTFRGEDAPRFTAVPGRIAFLGKFETVTRSSYPSTSFRIDPHPRMSQRSAEELINKAYPTLQVDLVDVASLPE